MKNLASIVTLSMGFTLSSSGVLAVECRKIVEKLTITAAAEPEKNNKSTDGLAAVELSFRPKTRRQIHREKAVKELVVSLASSRLMIGLEYDGRKTSSYGSPVSVIVYSIKGEYSSKRINGTLRIDSKSDDAGHYTYSVTGKRGKLYVFGIEKGKTAGRYIEKIRKEDAVIASTDTGKINVFKEDIIPNSELGDLADPDFIYVRTRFQEYNLIAVVNDALDPLKDGTRIMQRSILKLSDKAGHPIVETNLFMSLFDFNDDGSAIRVATLAGKILKQRAILNPTDLQLLQVQNEAGDEIAENRQSDERGVPISAKTSGSIVQFGKSQVEEILANDDSFDDTGNIANSRGFGGEFGPATLSRIAMVFGYSNMPSNNQSSWKTGLTGKLEQTLSNLSLAKMASNFLMPLTPENLAKINDLLENQFDKDKEEFKNHFN